MIVKHRLIFVLVMVLLVLAQVPVSAKIRKTRETGQYRDYHEFPLTIGSGIEYETDEEGSEYGFPFLIEYGLTDAITVALEPDFVVVDPVERPAAHGFGELETSVVYEYLRERRNRPALSAELLVKWPTATHDSLGTGEIDYSLGAIASKEFVHFTVDFEVLYTLVGSPPGIQLDDALEISLASDVHLSAIIDLELELVTSTGGGIRSRVSAISGPVLPSDVQDAGGQQTEGTIGIAEKLTSHLKLEQGVLVASDGSWQLLAAWEWDFSEGE
jgi:hypothetical protein